MKNKVLLAIFVICLASSIVLAFIPAEDACGDNQQNRCNVVAKSNYSETILLRCELDALPFK